MPIHRPEIAHGTTVLATSDWSRTWPAGPAPPSTTPSCTPRRWRSRPGALVNAGHPPPLTISADSTTRLLALTDSVPLGAGPDDRTAQHITLPAGATLIGYTDGLIERRDEDITDGLHRLISHSHLLHDVPLAAGLRRLTDTLHDGHRDDDVTTIAIRRRHPHN